MVPVLIGNIIGGTALFALIAYAQVMKEFSHSDCVPTMELRTTGSRCELLQLL